MAVRPVKTPYREGKPYGASMWYGRHEGIDYLPAIPGHKDKSYSPVNGKYVRFVGGDCHGLDIQAKNGDIHRVCHIYPIAVSVGKELKQGQYIGNMSTKGLTWTVHNHWAVIRNGRTIDPQTTLTTDLNELRNSINSLFRAIYHRSVTKADNDYYLSRIGQPKPLGITTLDDLIDKMKYWAAQPLKDWEAERKKVLNK